MTDVHIYMLFGASVTLGGIVLTFLNRAGDGSTSFKLFGQEITLAAAGGILVMLLGTVVFVFPAISNRANLAGGGLSSPAASAPTSGSAAAGGGADSSKPSASSAAELDASTSSDSDQDTIKKLNSELADRDVQITTLKSQETGLSTNWGYKNYRGSIQDCADKIQAAVIANDPGVQQSMRTNTAPNDSSLYFDQDNVRITLGCSGGNIIFSLASNNYKNIDPERERLNGIIDSITF